MEPADPWHGARHFYHLAQTDPDLANGHDPYCYDEIHDIYTIQTRDKFRRLCARTTVESYVAVAYTLTPTMKDLVLGIKDGYAENPASALKIAGEFFVFGEDGHASGQQALACVDWYDEQGLLERLVPVFNVSNSPHKESKAYRAFSHEPGLVSYYWREILRRFWARNRYDVWLWGQSYKRIGEAPGRGAAVVALDHVLASLAFK